MCPIMGEMPHGRHSGLRVRQLLGLGLEMHRPHSFADNCRPLLHLFYSGANKPILIKPAKEQKDCCARASHVAQNYISASTRSRDPPPLTKAMNE